MASITARPNRGFITLQLEGVKTQYGMLLEQASETYASVSMNVPLIYVLAGLAFHRVNQTGNSCSVLVARIPSS